LDLAMKAQQLIRLGDRIGRTGVRLRLRRRGGDNEGKRREDSFHCGNPPGGSNAWVRKYHMPPNKFEARMGKSEMPAVSHRDERIATHATPARRGALQRLTRRFRSTRLRPSATAAPDLPTVPRRRYPPDFRP